MNDGAANKTYITKIGVLVMAAGVFFYLPGIQEFFLSGLAYLRERNFEGLRLFILSYGMWAPLTSIALMVIQSMVPLVPGLAITITNAWVFGWEQGALYSWTGALLGAALDFGIARWYGRPVIERVVSSALLDKTDMFFRHNGVLAVFITRLIPIVPFKVVSYGAGLTDMPVLRFIGATGIGQTPPIVLYSFLAQYAVRSLRTAAAITSLLIALAVLVYYYRHSIERFFASWSNKE